MAEFTFEKDRRYDLRLEYYEDVFAAVCRLVWDVDVAGGIPQAVECAAASDVAIVTCGVIDGEGRDRADLELPPEQEQLIGEVTATGKPTLVVLLTGSVVPMANWIDDVGAVLVAWHPGEEGGTALAQVIAGAANPGGRLPITFPRRTSQVPIYYNRLPTYKMVSNSDYTNLPGTPLFPFGFGLSYTTFDYSDLRLSKSRIRPDEAAEVSVAVRNSGERTGDEVVQLYIHDRVASTAQPLKALKGFCRVSLAPGETARVGFRLGSPELAIWDHRMRRVVEPGEFDVMLGASSEDIRLRAVLRVRKA
jgi:beta-glucosidase